MRPPSFATLACLALSGCDGPGASDVASREPSLSPSAFEEVAGPEAERRPHDAAGGVVIGQVTGEAVPYGCDRTWRGDEVERLHPVTAGLLAEVHLGDAAAPSASRALGAAIERALAADVAELPSRDRVLIQAAAARAARTPEHAARGAALVRHAALAPSALRRLGSDPSPDLSRFLGPSDAWVERRGPSCGPLGAHDSVYGGALAFRTLRSGARRALVGQIIAYDTSAEPHVTPHVALVELRDGMHADSPACVIEVGAGGLAPVAYEELRPTPFVRPASPGRVGCGSCHSGQGPYDLTDVRGEEALSFRIERRVAQLTHARERGADLFASAP